jgi:hypothetical protein
MPFPSIEDFAVLASGQDITLTPTRLAQAYEAHRTARPVLERLREVPLPFLEPSEPAAALLWLRKGGKS